MSAGCRIQTSSIGACLLVAALVGGCAQSSKWYSQDQLHQGYTIVLPGILGRGPWDHSLAKNLKTAASPQAVEICDWTKGPVLFVYNAMAEKRKRAQARQIAQRIVEYQTRYPGRPVHLVGHSGGANLAVFALEALPPEHRIESATLLGAGMPRNYDLTSALTHTKSGVHNYYSYLDIPVSMVFSGLLTVVRGHPQPIAGAIGFQPREEGQATGAPQLVQHRYGMDMLPTGHWGGHFGWTVGPFVRKQLAPLLSESSTQLSADSTIQPVTFIVSDQDEASLIEPQVGSIDAKK